MQHSGYINSAEKYSEKGFKYSNVTYIVFFQSELDYKKISYHPCTIVDDCQLMCVWESISAGVCTIYIHGVRDSLKYKNLTKILIVVHYILDPS